MSLLEKMAQSLGLPEAYVRGVVNTASHRYKEYQIAKRSGGLRTIHHPSRELKCLQRWLLDRVVKEIPCHPVASAYETRCSILKHAEQHKKSAYLLRMDLKNFFPSLAADDIKRLLRKHHAVLLNGMTQEDMDDFSKTVCRYDVLTIGSVTSPGLSNRLCYQMDVRISELVAEQGVIYTRYADDFYFSCSDKKVLSNVEKDVVDIVARLDFPRDLRFNKKKTHHTSKRRRRVVTGVVLTSEGGLSVGRDLKRTIKSKIYQFDKLSAKECRSLAGQIGFVESIEPGFKEKMEQKYGSKTLDLIFESAMDSVFLGSTQI